jgi:DNA-binding SARP family transcriptional activator
MVLRIYVAGRVGLERGDTFVSEDRLVGRQGRVVLAMLATAGVGEQEIALRHARHLVRAEPLRESGWRLLMRLHQEAGNSAEALAAYEECRRTLAEQLGVRPSAPTEALYVEILGAS